MKKNYTATQARAALFKIISEAEEDIKAGRISRIEDLYKEFNIKVKP